MGGYDNPGAATVCPQSDAGRHNRTPRMPVAAGAWCSVEPRSAGHNTPAGDPCWRASRAPSPTLRTEGTQRPYGSELPRGRHTTGCIGCGHRTEAHPAHTAPPMRGSVKRHQRAQNEGGFSHNLARVRPSRLHRRRRPGPVDQSADVAPLHPGQVSYAGHQPSAGCTCGPSPRLRRDPTAPPALTYHLSRHRRPIRRPHGFSSQLGNLFGAQVLGVGSR